MLLPVALDRLPVLAGSFAAMLSGWSPVGRAVRLVIEDCHDDRLYARQFRGAVRGYDPFLHGGPLLIHLDKTLRYEEPQACHYVDVLVATSALRWHRPERLLVSWCAVRLTDAGSFAEHSWTRTIGTGRLMLL